MGKRTVFVQLVFFLLASIAARAAATAPANDTLPVAPVANGSQQVELGNSALALMGPWKFRLGSEMAWALPDFKDSGWENLTLQGQGWSESLVDPNEGSDPGWAGHGHRGVWGYGWYRIHLNLQKTAEPVSLLVPVIDTTYSIYWDGQKLGGFGDTAEHKGYVRSSKLFAIPVSLSLPGAHVLAIQVWDQPSQALQLRRQDGGLRGAPLLVAGPLAVKLQELAHRSQILWLISDTAPDLIAGIVGIFTMMLFTLNRARLEYLWIALTLFCFVIPDAALSLSILTSHVTYQTYAISYNMFTSRLLPLFGLLAAIWLVDLQRKRWLVAWLLASWSLFFLISLTVEIELRFALFSNQLLGLYGPISLVALGNFIAILLYVAVAGVLTQGREAWIELSPGLLVFGFFLTILALANMHASITLIISLYTSFLSLIPLSVVTIVLRRFLRQRRDHQRIEAELLQAQAVQALLVPERLPQTPQYQLEGMYLPASQVGGDFYQVLPLPESELIVVLGDVSGKGLQAAMVVSMVVGAVRAIVKETQRPAEILERLNEELTGNLRSGFVTCFCAHVDAAGTVIMANAGHLSPWVNGVEVVMPGALPLGMLAGQEYETGRFHLNNGDMLTIMSDGIVEARRERDGRLYGFDQLATLLLGRPSAEEIARTAQRFGQEDDISVIQIKRIAAPELPFVPMPYLVQI
jgi:hypothetical protein